MRRFLFPALALATALMTMPAMATESAGSGGFYRHTPGRPMISRMNVTPAVNHNFNRKYQGRWVGGWQAPGGWAAYRRPYRGFVTYGATTSMSSGSKTTGSPGSPSWLQG